MINQFWTAVLAASFFAVIGYSNPARGAAADPPDLAVSIPVGGGTVETGENFSYEIRLTNIGQVSATDTELVVNLPTQGAFVGAETTLGALGTCDFVAGPPPVLNCALGILSERFLVVVDIDWTAPNTAATLTLSVQATNSIVEGSDANNSAQVTTDVVAPPVDNGDNNNDNNNDPGANNAADSGGCSLGSGLHSQGGLAMLLAILAGFVVTRHRSLRNSK